MMIELLSKSELVLYNEKLVCEYLEKQNYSVNKIIEGRLKTKFRITRGDEVYIIKIIGYRYNSLINGNYAYILKHVFDLKEFDFLFFVMYMDSKVSLLKIPSYIFKNPAQNSAFKNRDYIGKKSLPEYGIVMNKNTLKELLMYEETYYTYSLLYNKE